MTNCSLAIFQLKSVVTVVLHHRQQSLKLKKSYLIRSDECRRLHSCELHFRLLLSHNFFTKLLTLLELRRNPYKLITGWISTSPSQQKQRKTVLRDIKRKKINSNSSNNTKMQVLQSRPQPTDVTTFRDSDTQQCFYPCKNSKFPKWMRQPLLVMHHNIHLVPTA